MSPTFFIINWLVLTISHRSDTVIHSCPSVSVYSPPLVCIYPYYPIYYYIAVTTCIVQLTSRILCRLLSVGFKYLLCILIYLDLEALATRPSWSRVLVDSPSVSADSPFLFFSLCCRNACSRCVACFFNPALSMDSLVLFIFQFPFYFCIQSIYIQFS